MNRAGAARIDPKSFRSDPKSPRIAPKSPRTNLRSHRIKETTHPTPVASRAEETEQLILHGVRTMPENRLQPLSTTTVGWAQLFAMNFKAVFRSSDYIYPCCETHLADAS